MKPRIFRADDTGVSMSWRLFALLVGVGSVAGVGHLWTTFGVKTTASAFRDSKDHEADPEAHEPVQAAFQEKIAQNLAPVTAAVRENTRAIKQTEQLVIKVKNGFYAMRCDELSYRAVDQLPRGTSRRRMQQVSDQVRRVCVRNLDNDRDPRSGLERYFPDP